MPDDSEATSLLRLFFRLLTTLKKVVKVEKQALASNTLFRIKKCQPARFTSVRSRASSPILFVIVLPASLPAWTPPSEPSPSL